MIFNETPLSGVYVIDPEEYRDDRGLFARAWCRKEFEAQGLSTDLCQTNLSYNPHRGTLRGMHWQRPPYAENKLVRCVRGAILDVAVDLREGSPTRFQWFGAELTAENRSMLWVPEGFAHGFQTIADETEVLYQVTQFYHPDSEQGARHDDPAFGITWPLPVSRISPKDASWPDYEIAKPETST